MGNRRVSFNNVHGIIVLPWPDLTPNPKTVFNIIGKQIITAWLGRNAFVKLLFDILWHATCNIFRFLNLLKKYLKNALFRRNLTFQIRVKISIFVKFSVLDLHKKKMHLDNFFGGFFMKSWYWKPSYLVVHTLNLVGKICLAQFCPFCNFNWKFSILIPAPKQYGPK